MFVFNDSIILAFSWGVNLLFAIGMIPPVMFKSCMVVPFPHFVFLVMPDAIQYGQSNVCISKGFWMFYDRGNGILSDKRN
jgi:hypothetical protein